MTEGTCASCHRSIDASARLCPYCGADPTTGERVDTEAILQEVFQTRRLSTSETVVEYAKQRQGIVVAVTILVAFLLLAALHQFVTMRNATAVTDAPAVPLSELTDVTNTGEDPAPVEMPELNFAYEGDPRRMRTFIVESGAIAPPEVAAAQQQTQRGAAAQTPAAGGARPQQSPPGAARPQQPQPARTPQSR